MREVPPRQTGDDLEMASEVASPAAQDLAVLGGQRVSDLDAPEEVSGGEIVPGVRLDERDAEGVVWRSLGCYLEVRAEPRFVADLRERVGTPAFADGHVAIGARPRGGGRSLVFARCGL